MYFLVEAEEEYMKSISKLVLVVAMIMGSIFPANSFAEDMFFELNAVAPQAVPQRVPAPPAFVPGPGAAGGAIGAHAGVAVRGAVVAHPIASPTCRPPCGHGARRGCCHPRVRRFSCCRGCGGCFPIARAALRFTGRVIAGVFRGIFGRRCCC